MNKGIRELPPKGPSFDQLKKSAMKVKSPISKSNKGISGNPGIPAVRPTSMRNLSPWKGFNGK